MGNPRRWTLPVEALALLEPLGPPPALVAALQVAERALALASELGMPSPARALAFRGMACVSLGDPRGLQDFREARWRVLLRTPAR